MNILITGSGGFIGKSLAEYFKKNTEFNLYCPNSCDLNLLNSHKVKDFFEQNRIDFIIHCATKGGIKDLPDELGVYKDNIEMVNNLLSYKKNSCKVILFSSGAMYDRRLNIKCFEERDYLLRKPVDLYGMSKQKIATYANERNDVLCLVIFACYGIYEKNSRFPTLALNDALDGKNIVIENNRIFDYLYIDDLSRIVEFFISNEESWADDRIINATPDSSCSMADIAHIAISLTNSESKVILLKPEQGNEYTGSNLILHSKLKKLNFTPLSCGLKRLLEFIKKKN